MLVTDICSKNDFETPSLKPKNPPKKGLVSLKEADFNKLRSAIMYRPKQTESLFATEFSVIPECLTKNREMYHGNKSLLLHAYDPDPSTKTIQPSAIVIDISAVIRSQTANTTAYTFDDFTTEVIKTLVTLANGCSRIDIVTDSYFNISLKGGTRLSRGIGQFLPFEPRTPIPKDFKDNLFSNSRNKHAFNAFLTKKLLEYDFVNVKIVVSVDDVILSHYLFRFRDL